MSHSRSVASLAALAVLALLFIPGLPGAGRADARTNDALPAVSDGGPANVDAGSASELGADAVGGATGAFVGGKADRAQKGAMVARALGDFADPYVAFDGNAYYAFATEARSRHVQVARSRDLTTWEQLDDALPALPSWASNEPGLTWAPAVSKRGDRWVLYYTARDAASGFQCISRATSNRPEGPYVDDSARPFVCQISMCGSIDPSPFVDDDGRPYLVWKSDENAAACHSASRLWSQPLTDDGLSLVGKPAMLLASDRPWEQPLIEGPSMFRDASGLYLFYSASYWDSSSYSIGYARCEGPMGPCVKETVDAPLAKSAANVLGPGGQEAFVAADGRPMFAYHAWTAPFTKYEAGGARTLRFAHLSFADGSPTLSAVD